MAGLPNTLQGSLLSLRKKVIVPPPPSGATPIDRADYVKLVSKEGHIFIVHRQCAMVSRLIKGYLTGQTAVATAQVGWDASAPDVVTFSFVTAVHLEKVVQYFYYKFRYDNDPDHRPDFYVPPEMALDLIQIATTLQC